MTALEKYERLESLGLWRENAEAQRIEVIVSFGDASLVLSDANNRPYTHWSLAALERKDTGQPAIYTADPDGAETLEIDDEAMIRAIEKTRTAIERRRPHPGRLRFYLGGAVIAAFVVFLIMWLPDAAARYATSIVPDAKAQEIGARAVHHASQITGKACDASPQQARILRKLENRLLKSPNNKLLVVDMANRPSALLPGGNILLNKSLLTQYEGPEVFAGYALLERANEDENPPLYDLFKTMSTREIMRFLATGEIKIGPLDTYAETRITGPISRPSMGNLAALFEVAEFSSAEFATVERDYAQLALNDAYEAGYAPLLSDEDWLTLREICD